MSNIKAYCPAQQIHNQSPREKFCKLDYHLLTVTPLNVVYIIRVFLNYVFVFLNRDWYGAAGEKRKFMRFVTGDMIHVYHKTLVALQKIRRQVF